jgi:hypothetical protein
VGSDPGATSTTLRLLSGLAENLNSPYGPTIIELSKISSLVGKAAGFTDANVETKEVERKPLHHLYVALSVLWVNRGLDNPEESRAWLEAGYAPEKIATVDDYCERR